MADIKYYGLESHFNENVTFYKDVTINGNLNYDSLLVKNLTVNGKTTLGITTTTDLYVQNISVRDQTTLGITSTTNLSAQNLNIFNTSTVGDIKISSGIITATSGITTYYGDGSNLKVDGNNITSLIPSGTIISYASSTAPTGYLKCNGAAISRSTYSSLFSSIGTTYGSGDGSTTFNLPDLRGEFVRGWDDGRGVDSGRAMGSAQLDAAQRITGEQPGTYAAMVRGAGTGAFSSSVGSAGAYLTSPYYSTAQYGDILRFDSANSPGARTASETRPRNVALLYCIKY